MGFGQRRMLTGALLMLVASVAAVFDAVVVKLIAGEVHPFEIVFFRNLFSMFALMLILRGSEWSLRGNGLWGYHLARAWLKLFALAAAFFAVAQLPLATATAIAFTTPIFTVLGSILLLREPAKIARLVGLVLGFLGVIVVVRPTSMALGIGAVLALASAVALSAVMLLLKVSSSRDQGKRVVWLNLVVIVPTALALCLPFWSWPSLPALGLMALQGVGGLLAQLSVTKALRLADASSLVVVDFVRLPLSLVLGMMLFAEPIDSGTLLGGGLILIALLLLVREARREPL